MSAPIRFSSLASHPISSIVQLRRRLIAGSPVALAIGLLLAVMLVLLPVGDTARADALSDARAAGTVGERFDGYLALRDPSAPASARQLVEDINTKRRQLYNQVSTREGTTIDAVGRIYAREIVGTVPRGTWILQENGQWVQK